MTHATTTGALGIFVNRFEDALARFRRRSISTEEAGELLGVSGRQFHRMCVRFDGEGSEGRCDRRPGLVSSRRADPAEIGRTCGVYRDRYRDFAVKHFHEAVNREYHYKLRSVVTRLASQSAGLVLRGPSSAFRHNPSYSPEARARIIDIAAPYRVVPGRGGIRAIARQ